MFEDNNEVAKSFDKQAQSKDLDITLQDFHALSTSNLRNLSDKQMAALNATVDTLFGTPEFFFGNSTKDANTTADTAAQGQAIAAQLAGNMQANAGDIAAARSAYGSVSGISLSAAAARGALDSAINSATYRLDARNSASGSGDNLDWVQANFANVDAYRAWKKEVTTTVGNSTIATSEKRSA